jgi:tRNA acetyltransferase TAN1
MAHQGGEKYWKNKTGDSVKAGIAAGDSGVFLSCDMGKEANCIADGLDIFSQV